MCCCEVLWLPLLLVSCRKCKCRCKRAFACVCKRCWSIPHSERAYSFFVKRARRRESDTHAERTLVLICSTLWVSTSFSAVGRLLSLPISLSIPPLSLSSVSPLALNRNKIIISYLKLHNWGAQSQFYIGQGNNHNLYEVKLPWSQSWTNRNSR